MVLKYLGFIMKGYAGILKYSLIVFVVSTLVTATSLYIFLSGYLIDKALNKHKSSSGYFNEDTTAMNVGDDADSLSLVFFLDSLTNNADTRASKLSGNRVTISICGLDSRIGTNTKHADANHILNIWLDSAIIEVISIPRGSYSDVGYDDTTGLNYLANYRAARGREAYLNEIQRITKIAEIDYYCEFGFSQAIGLLEMLGYKENAVQTLRVLRSRKGFSTGDYQRAYNQGQFIRQMILSHFNNLSGLLGELTLRGALMLVESNLNFSDIKSIYDTLHFKGFPKSRSDVFVRLCPRFQANLQKFDFTDDYLLDSLYKSIARKNYDSSETDTKFYKSESVSGKVSKRLNSLLKAAIADTARNPKRAVSRLRGIYDQRAWFQITDSAERAVIRNKICFTLSDLYLKIDNEEESKRIQLLLKVEDELYRRMK